MIRDIQQFSIPNVSNQITNSLELIVKQILEDKEQNPAADTTNLETQIDQLVYQLYELTEEEIKIIEGN